MVSLVNFKIVDDDELLQQRGGGANPFGAPPPRVGAGNRLAADAAASGRQLSNRSAISEQQQVAPQSAFVETMSESACDKGAAAAEAKHRKLQLPCKSTAITFDNYQPIAYATSSTTTCLQHQQSAATQAAASASGRDDADSERSCSLCEPPSSESAKSHFVVTWRNLKYCIEPKWHQKLSTTSPLASLADCIATPAMKTTSQLGAASQQTPPTGKIVLDQLDGSFRSGELTAILGPSGAGKTTLLDCLTGHRKSGLSGSIRIDSSLPSELSTEIGASCSASSGCVNSNGNNIQRNMSSSTNCGFGANSAKLSKFQPSLCGAKQSLPAPPAASPSSSLASTYLVGLPPPRLACCGKTGQHTNSNLKVSIIPQNDHLMGHLTVQETLGYASKMKNCFDRQFDHNLNIKRVAKQLGLLPCLGTRVNKLSGGQYKRVSIAQELLSSPDILILDEPTSGLDAMTCYQTVQVLRELTDERQIGSGQKPIAVILTIHQPNSDVFQQFNHVYVVAQGGKCIYEGSPAQIESVINRIGIRLPSSYYNPATMIVEIAAGKFGCEAINKLNVIQRKRYELAALHAPDDSQNSSTGDSAVDCPSSSSNDEDGHDDNCGDEDDATNNNKTDKDAADGNLRKGAAAEKVNDVELNNNSVMVHVDEGQLGGLVNKGFVLEADSGASLFGANHVAPGRQQVGGGGSAQDNCASSSKQQVDKIKPPAHPQALDAPVAQESAGDTSARRKKRRRTRKRVASAEPSSGCGGIAFAQQQNDAKELVKIVCAAKGDTGVDSGGGGGGGGGAEGREKRLKLNSLRADQKFPFWRHTYLHFHRSWLSIVRDPMLCSMQLALHIIVPVMVSLVYGTRVGKPNACPRAGPVDIMAYALEPTDSALQLQEDLRTTLENIGYIFFKLYGIIFAAMTVTVLTFPLDMHVLVKEFRNGWYGLSSYFLGRTLADIPFQLTLPLLAMSLSYYATGQPYSYMQWRFFSITAILILSSLIAQSQGLLFGAILMDKMKAAVFVAPAATTPIILFAGFLVRTQSIPRYLRPLSNLSYLRYAIEACLISRYGYNQCECDDAVFNQTVPELPPIARSMLDYWLSSFKPAPSDESGVAGNGSLASGGLHLLATNATSLETTTTIASGGEQQSQPPPDLFTKLIDSLGRANSFGRNMTSCEQVVPYPMIDYDLKDSQLFSCFAILLLMLVVTRLLTFFIVCFKVRRKV